MRAGQSPKKGDVLVLVGTRKGAFILSSGQNQKDWAISGSYHAGSDVFHVTYNGRGSGKVYAAVNTMIWGPHVEISPDLGQTWVSASQQPRFSGGGSETVERIWQITPAGKTEPGVFTRV